MGAVFGFSFGFLDVEDDTSQRLRFSKDQSIASCTLCALSDRGDTSNMALQPWEPLSAPSSGSLTSKYRSDSRI
jgi:hypothetical protein